MNEYKRLTIKDSCYYDEMDNVDIDRLYARLAELEDKIESKHLVELPCKVGDTVYWAWILEREQAEVFDGKIRGLSISHNGTVWFSVVYNNGLTFEHTFKDDWNKTVFLTKAKAEARLKELKGEM